MLKKYHYWNRIFKAYVLGKTSHLTFWHGEPKLNSNFKLDEIGPYYMQFYQKANYNGFFDKNGIPFLDYQGEIGKQYNPIAIAQWGLGNYNLWMENGQLENKEKFLLCSNWMEKNLTKLAKTSVWMHNFDFEYRDTLKKPWFSGLAQGQGLSVLLRAYKETGSEKYLDAAYEVFKSFTIDVNEGGVCFTDENGFSWIEEYIVNPPTHILNGFIWALWGVYDYAIFLKNDEARKLFNNFSKTILHSLSSYDIGYWSKYEHSGTIIPMIASIFYHKLHVVQLLIMYKLTNERLYLEYHLKWKKYLFKSHYKLLSVMHKVVFKVLYY